MAGRQTFCITLPDLESYTYYSFVFLFFHVYRKYVLKRALHTRRLFKCPHKWGKIYLNPYSKVHIGTYLTDIHPSGMIILNQYESKLKLLNNF